MCLALLGIFWGLEVQGGFPREMHSSGRRLHANMARRQEKNGYVVLLERGRWRREANNRWGAFVVGG